MNFAAGAPANPNLGVVEVGADGTICYAFAVAAHHVILDIVSVLKADAITAIDPVRVLDTRGPAGAVPIEIDVTFFEGSDVANAYPDYPGHANFSGNGVLHKGHTGNPALDQRFGAVDVGTVRGWIVDNGDGTVTGEAFLEDRWGSTGASSFRLEQGASEFVEIYDVSYEGFAVVCPEAEELAPPGLYVFQSHLPILISGTTREGSRGTTYQLTTTAGVGATPGNPGGTPEIETVIDDLDRCAAGFAYCETIIRNIPCGKGYTLDDVAQDRADYIVEHLRITEALIENFNVTTSGGSIRVAERTEFQVGIEGRDDVSFRVRLGY